MPGSLTMRCMAMFMRVVIAPMTLFALLYICGSGLAIAATPAGTVIKNQASASYRDGDGVLHVATSNIVETLIQQVAALQLAQDQTRPVVAGKQVFLSHTITNTGNGVDSYTLDVVNGGAADDFDLGSLTIYPDANQDGQPDVYVPVLVTPSLAMQQSWNFVIAGLVSPGTPAGNVANVQISATSQYNSTISAANTDSVTVTDGAVIEVDKTISATSGASPDGPLTISLGYRNVGTQSAQSVVLLDALPAGMQYVASSGRWNETGSLVLTDSGSADMQGGAESIIYCAYHTTCGGVPEANSDPDNDATNQVTAIVSEVPAGSSGVLTFDVMIASGLDASVLLNTGEFEYTSNAVLSNRYVTNTVSFNVLHQPAVVVNGSESDSTDGVNEPLVVPVIAQGSQVVFKNTVWNTGNGSDTFDLDLQRVTASFPAGSIYRLLQSDAMTPLLDSNGNGLPDTGPLAAGASYVYHLQVTPPTATIGDNGGTGYEIGVVAYSTAESSVSNPINNQLLDISTASLDMTNVAALGDSEALGEGAGPESSPVSTATVAPGAETVIGLYVNNNGQTPVSADLSVTTHADYSSIELPDNWVVEFRIAGDDSNTTSTGVINPGEHVLVNATVRVPVDAEIGDVSLYFRASSNVTGAMDVKHDQVTVTALEALLLELDQNGQTGPGGSYVYNHMLSNIGNVTIADVQLDVVNDVDGWTSIIYEDTNDNGQLDASDQAISSVASLTAGQIQRLFVKVFAPAAALATNVNQTQLTATWSGGSEVVTDSTTVAEIEISILKEQAPDYGCTGTLDGAYGVAGFAVEPGNNCVSYRLTATNAGQGTAFNVDVADATPAFTEYFGAAACSHTSCTVIEPPAGGQGNVVASIPSLDAGDIVTLSFSVRVE